MGKKAKSSRKGKKAWRANISTDDIEEYFEKSTKDALSGGSLADAPSDSLFFVDKSRDLSVKRKIEKHRQKVLHCDSLLQRNPFIQPISSSKQKKKNRSKEIQTATTAAKDCEKDNGIPDSGIVDIWSHEGENIVKSKRKPKPSIIPAVEVEHPGCSFNPAPESHQDSLALAVADEMQKVYREELGPEPVPLTVPGEAIDEENMYFLDADDGSDDDNPNEGEDNDFEKRPIKTKKVTRVEQNRRARWKGRLRAEEESKKAEKLSSDIDSLPDIMQQIAKEDEEKQRRHLRRTVAEQERLKVRPPRIGKYKFEPAPQQVLLSEEITGSLRKLKGCCTLARDRYKSLEKRGLVAPTKKSSRMAGGIIMIGNP